MWDDISTFFKPPKKYASDFGNYRSPLLFGDGREVKTASQWKRRRKEILDYWHRVMGPWPAFLRAPKIVCRSAKRIGGVTRHTALVEVAADWPMWRGYLLVPEGAKKRAAVLGVYYDAETLIGKAGGPRRDFCLQLAKRGFVTLALGCEPNQQYFPSVRNAQLQPCSFHGFLAAACHNAMAGLPEVDPARIGIVGHSYGGKWSMFGSCLYDKFACAAWCDPGIVFDESMPGANYWDVWYLGYERKNRRPPWSPPSKKHPRTGAYRKLVEDGRDLHELHALMAPRPFLVSGGVCDPSRRWRALNHSVEVNRLLGFNNRVAMTNRRNHSPSAKSNEQLYAFLKYFLMGER